MLHTTRPTFRDRTANATASQHYFIVAPFETALRMLTTDASYHYFIDQYHIGGGQELIRTSDLRRHSCVCLYVRLFKYTSELE